MHYFSALESAMLFLCDSTDTLYWEMQRHHNRENDTVVDFNSRSRYNFFTFLECVFQCPLVIKRSSYVEHEREFIATLYIMLASGMSHIRRSPLSYYLLSSCFFFTFLSSYNSLSPPFLSSFLILVLSLSLALSFSSLSFRFSSSFSLSLSLLSVIFLQSSGFNFIRCIYYVNKFFKSFLCKTCLLKTEYFRNYSCPT